MEVNEGNLKQMDFIKYQFGCQEMACGGNFDTNPGNQQSRYNCVMLLNHRMQIRIDTKIYSGAEAQMPYSCFFVFFLSSCCCCWFHKTKHIFENKKGIMIKISLCSRTPNCFVHKVRYSLLFSVVPAPLVIWLALDSKTIHMMIEKLMVG